MRRVLCTVIALAVTVGLRAQSIPNVATKPGGEAPRADQAQTPSAATTTTVNVTQPEPDATASQSPKITTPSGPIAQQGDMGSEERRTLLMQLQNTHHALQQLQAEVTRQYTTACPNLHRQVTDPCATLHLGMAVELPHLIRRVQDEIIALAVRVGIDPTEALR